MITIDREIIQNSFRQWEAEQATIDAQVADSMAALTAYQSHLDGWQKGLAQEREELRRQQEALDHSQSFAGDHQQQLDERNRELSEARQEVASLTSALLARSEELHELDRQRAQLNTELAIARSRDRELTAALEAQQIAFEKERQKLEAQGSIAQPHNERPPSPPSAGANEARAPNAENGHAKKNPSALESPVLGSLMEQFGKLRQQRSMNRPNQPKPR